MKSFLHAVRSLWRTPSLSIIIVSALALGIGAITATFSVANTLLIRPLPYPDADRLAFIWGNFLKLRIQHLPAKSAEFVEYQEQSQSFGEVAAFENRDYTFSADGLPLRLVGTRVSEHLLDLVGATVILGRPILQQDFTSGENRVAVISNKLWQTRFNASPTIVGATIDLDEQKYEIVGVTAPQFIFPHSSFSFAAPADFWTPLILDRKEVTERSGGYQLNVIARLKDGVTLAEAQATLDSLARRMEASYHGYRGPKGEDGGWRIMLIPISEEVSASSRTSLLVLLGISGLVLLITCANIANLLVLRSKQRMQEFAIRMALGATKGHIARRILLESALLGVIGGVAGYVLANWSLDVLIAINPNQLPRLGEVTADWRVITFATLVSVGSGILSGLAPALSRWPVSLAETMRESGSVGSRRSYLRSGLVATQIAVSVTVLLSAALLIRSLITLQSVNPGLNAKGVLAFELSASERKYREPADVGALVQEVLYRVAALPGVESVGTGSIFPLSGNASDDPFSIEGRLLDMDHLTLAGHQTVSADFFRALEISMISGRCFADTDTPFTSPVAIINSELARRYFGEGDAIGHRIKLGAPMGPAPWTTIVGVVNNIPHRSLESTVEPDWYLPQTQSPSRRVYFFVRTSLDPMSLTISISKAIGEIDPGVVLLKPQTLGGAVAATLAPRRFNTMVASLFAAVALLLACSGVYGVIAYFMQSRTREIGVRMALGAQRRDITRMAIREASLPIIVGLTSGMVFAVSVSRLLRTLLFGVTPTDPVAAAVIGLLIASLALLACYVPAHRASSIDPLVALRYE
jgi:putative ABC transport system permease protein